VPGTQWRLCWLVIVGCLLVSPSWGQEKKVALSLTADQAMMIVQTLGQIQCTTVSTLATCQKAAELLKEIQEQARSQVK
jgi:hypothetical protein